MGRHMGNTTEKFILGADHAGFPLKEAVAKYLKEQGVPHEDIGCYSTDRVDYPNIAFTLAHQMKDGAFTRGVLCCGSGIGVSMAANRFPHVRAVVAHDLYTAQMSRRHNDANVLCMGARFIAPELACEILKTWMETPFEGGRHQERVNMMEDTKLLNGESQGERMSC